MARIRTIKPAFWKHEELSELPEATHMLAAALLNYADDFGYFNANPRLIKAECSPLREPSVTVPESLQKLHAIGWIRIGRGSDGKAYGQVVKFEEHQKVSHPTDSKIAKISIVWLDADETPENSGAVLEPLRPEGNKEEEGNKEARESAEIVRRETFSDLIKHFDAWWEVYPRKEARGRALKVYQKLLPKTDHATLLAGAQRYRDKAGREPKFTKLPATWLNDEAWLDATGETPGPKKPTTSAPSVGTPAWEENQRRIMGDAA